MFLNRLLLTPVLAGSLFLSACASTNPATGRTSLNLVGDQRARDIGASTAAALVEEHGLYKEKPKLTAYLGDKVQALVSVSETPNDRFDLKFLDTDIFNAAATPGFIFVNRGILPFFNDEAEMMAVLGHEVGHVTADHVQRQMSSGMMMSIGLTAASILVGASTNSQQAAEATARLGGFGAHAGMASFSRDHEREADMLGVRYISRLNYDPYAARDTFRSMEAYENLNKRVLSVVGKDHGKSLLGNLMSTHPLSKERVANTHEHAQKVPAPGKLRHKDRYFQMIDGLAFGPKPADGVFGHGRYYNTDYRFTYNLPKFWMFPRLKGLPEAVHPETKSSLVIFAHKFKKDQDAEEALFVKFPWLGDVKRIENPHAEIFTGILTPRRSLEIKGYARVAMVRSISPMSDKTRGKGLLFVFNAPTKEAFNKLDKDFMAMVQSYRWMSKRTADRIQPLRVKIHTAKAGETVESLSKKMPFSALHEDWFRALNGLVGNHIIAAGQKVKLIEDPNKNLRF